LVWKVSRLGRDMREVVTSSGKIHSKTVTLVNAEVLQIPR